jgi:hypothetical protein
LPLDDEQSFKRGPSILYNTTRSLRHYEVDEAAGIIETSPLG